MIISDFIFYFWGIKTLPTHNMLFTEMYLQIGVKPVDLFFKSTKNAKLLSIRSWKQFLPFKTVLNVQLGFILHFNMYLILEPNMS